jgi:hypothetical protein
MMTVTDEMLEAAMKKAVELEVFPKGPVDEATYLRHWASMKAVLQAAFEKAEPK